MTTGALIFAYNNEEIDYVSLAAWAADNIRRHLNIPVALVTDRPTDLQFDQVILCDSLAGNGRWFDDFEKHVVWKNDTRPMAYDLSPWDRTLVLDADYVVASDQLKVLLDSDREFLAHRRAYDITSVNDFQGLDTFGEHRMPMWWATVMMFGRNDHARLIFDSMKMIRDHWDHYKKIYQDRSKTYRNDHALSIALGMVNGHTLDHHSIPWPLASLTPHHKLSRVSQDHYRVDFTDTQNRRRWIEIKNTDFHAMGKKHLGELIGDNS